jgi:hypothetical protein
MLPALRSHLRRPGVIEPILFAVAVSLFAVQDLAISRISPDGDLAWLRRTTFFVATPLVILVALHFRRFAGACLIALGIFMNFIPMAAHGGNMPVAYEVVRDSGNFPNVTEDQIGSQIENSKDVLLWKDDIRFEPLSDRIVFTIPGYRPNIYSPGDVVIFVGVLVAAIEAIALAAGRRLDWIHIARRLVRRQPIAPG